MPKFRGVPSPRPTWLEYTHMGGTPVTSVLVPFTSPTLMVLPSGRDLFATRTLYHDVPRNKPATNRMSTAHMFDYTENGCSKQSHVGITKQRRLSSCKAPPYSDIKEYSCQTSSLSLN